MRILVFKHHIVEHPAILRDFMAADGVAWGAVEFELDQDIPPLDGYDALVVMGGAMDVWQEDAHPWLVREKAAIREAVTDRGLPYLGFCLGHQLLADALGGVVGPMSEPEVRVTNVEVTEAGAEDPLFAGFDGPIRCMQWHGAEIKTPPPGGATLATSERGEVEALRVGACAYGVQFHVESTAETVPAWSGIPEYQQSLVESLGAAGVELFKADMAANQAAFTVAARRLYDGFMGHVRARRVIRAA